MKISINRIYLADNLSVYEQIHQVVENTAYNSIGEAIKAKISETVQGTDWYQHEPYKFDLVQNFNDVEAICNNNMVCYMDSLNWSIMNKTELTADIYKFISHRMAVIREGFQNNFLPDHLNWDALIGLIDWQLVLDCISWFI